MKPVSKASCLYRSDLYSAGVPTSPQCLLGPLLGILRFYAVVGSEH